MTQFTYINAIDNALNGNLTEETIDKLNALKEQLAKRTSGNRKPTKNQQENEVIMDCIVEALKDLGTRVTVTELLKHGVGEYDITNQKASALLRKLVEAGRVSVEMDGKKKLFFAE